jgi:monoamine oxidase
MRPESMTRRQVLKSLGVLGGSSLMMGAMDTWSLMGKPAGPRPALRGPQASTRVIILGGGISGVTVGYELGKLDYDYRVLEARDRVGGLIWSVRRGDEHTEVGGERQLCDFDDGLYLNGGAWRIPHTDQGVLGYCKELGVRLELFVNDAGANFFYEDDPSIGPLSGKRVRLREAKTDLWGSTSELLAKAMDRGEIDVPLSAEDKERLVQFLVEAGYLDSTDHVYRPPSVREGGDPWDLSALLQSGFGARVRSVYAGTGGPAPLFQPVGGMQEIPKAIGRALGDRLTMGAEVRSVRQGPDDVHVVYRDRRTGQDHEMVADYVVCCLPMSILKGLDINLSSEMAAAVQATRQSDAAKMGLRMKRRFWEEDEGIFGGHLWSRSLQLGEFSYPCNDYFTQKGILLGYYGSGSQAGLNDMPVGGRVEHVLTQSSKVHPQMRDEFESAYAVWWEKVPYSLGAYGRTPSREQLAQLSRPDGRIYMGGAGASTRPDWMEGAIEAAWRTVEALHVRVQQS